MRVVKFAAFGRKDVSFRMIFVARIVTLGVQFEVANCSHQVESARNCPAFQRSLDPRRDSATKP